MRHIADSRGRSLDADNARVSTSFGLTAVRTTRVMEDETDTMDNCLLLNMTAHQLFGRVVPGNNTSWKDKTVAFEAFFGILLIVFGALFLALALVSVLLLWKRHLAQRFKSVRTFVAIDIALIILGSCRFLFVIIDPWGQFNFCTVKACIVVSRLIGSLAFPSLTASYTLVFCTLWMSAKINIGRSCLQNLKVLIPLCFAHYVVAITFEVIGCLPINSHYIVFLLLACEAFYAMWGFLVCVGFMIGGRRLLRTIEVSARGCSVVCKDSPNLSRYDYIEKSRQNMQARTRSTLKLKHMLQEKNRRAVRKVAIITYFTAGLGILYSAITLIHLVLVALILFGCQTMYPGVWLTLQYISFSIEFLLAILLTYAITDYQPVVKFFTTLLRRVYSLGGPSVGSESATDLSTSKVENITSSAGTPQTKVKFDFSITIEDSSDGIINSTPTHTPSKPSKMENNHSPRHPSPLLVSRHSDH